MGVAKPKTGVLQQRTATDDIIMIWCNQGWKMALKKP